MRIRVTHDIDDLASDLAGIATRARADMARVVRSNADQGNRKAKQISRRTAGAHGKHYPNAMTAEAITPLSWEYGPDAGRPQGGMSFEFGSRNQPPHLDLARSLDAQAPLFRRDAAKLPDKWFW